MVVCDAKEVKPKMMESNTLKFGMDRILSESIVKPNSNRLEVPGQIITQQTVFPQMKHKLSFLDVTHITYNGPFEKSNSNLSKSQTSKSPCVSPPPCAGCISSLYRCCRRSPSHGNAAFYRSGIHAPQPLRPYANKDSSVHRNLNGQQGGATGGTSKRKRSWSRAVFSNLQRKGLEKRFQLQKYITKPDRRQLAATLGLTDAQVKVWFQNRRMKWRHTKESSEQQQSMKVSGENILVSSDSNKNQNTDSEFESDIDVQTVDG